MTFAKKDKKENLRIKEIQKHLPLDVIVSLRGLVENYYTQQKNLIIEEAVRSKKWYSLKLTTERLKQKIAETIPKYGLNNKQVMALYLFSNNLFGESDVIEKLEETSKSKVSLSLEQCVVQLKNGSDQKFSPIASINVDNIKIESHSRSESMSVYGTLDSISMRDYFTIIGKEIKAITPVTQITKSPLLKLEFHNPPTDKKTSKAIKLAFKPLDILISPTLIDRIFTFFTPPELTVIQDFSTTASERLHGLKQEAEEQVKEAIKNKMANKNRETFDIQITIDAPNIILPVNFLDENSPRLILVLGTISFCSDLSNLNDNQSLDFYYDKFELQLTQMKCIVSNTSEWRKEILDENSRSVVLDKLNLYVEVKMLNVVSLRLPKLVVKANFFGALSFNLSSEKISHIINTVHPLTFIGKSRAKKPEIIQPKEKEKKERHFGEMIKKMDDIMSIGSTNESDNSLAELLEKKYKYLKNKNSKQIEFEFCIPYIVASLYQKSEDKFDDLLTVTINDINISASKSIHSLDANVKPFFVVSLHFLFLSLLFSKVLLKALDIIDHTKNSSSIFNKIISATEEGKDLVSISYKGTPKDSPIFVDVEHSLKLNFTGLTINLSRSTLLELASFAGKIILPKKDPEMKPIKLKKSKTKKKQTGKKEVEISLPKNPTNLLKVEANIGKKKKTFFLKILFFIFIFIFRSDYCKFEQKRTTFFVIEYW